MEFTYLFLEHNPKEFKKCKIECEFLSYFHVNLAVRNSSILLSLFPYACKTEQMSFLSAMHSFTYSDSLRLHSEGAANTSPYKNCIHLNEKSECLLYTLELVLMICVLVFVIKPDTLKKNIRKSLQEIKRCILNWRKLSRILFPYFVFSYYLLQPLPWHRSLLNVLRIP